MCSWCAVGERRCAIVIGVSSCSRSLPPFLIADNQPAKHINPQIQTGITHCSVLSKRSGFKRQIVGITYRESLTYESSFLSATAASFPHPQGRLCVKRLRRTYSPICFFCRFYLFIYFNRKWVAGSGCSSVMLPWEGLHETNMIKKKKVFVLCGWGIEVSRKPLFL